MKKADVIKKLKELYKVNKELIDMIGLEYDFDDDEYCCTKVNMEFDRDLMTDIDQLHGDLGYYLKVKGD